jgi:hypothetical protein
LIYDFVDQIRKLPLVEQDFNVHFAPQQTTPVRRLGLSLAPTLFRTTACSSAATFAIDAA